MKNIKGYAKSEGHRAMVFGLLLVLGLLLSSCAPLLTKKPAPSYEGQPIPLLLLEPRMPAMSPISSDAALALLQEKALTNPDFTKRFKIIDRSALQVMLREKRLSESGLTESNAQFLGKQSGALLYLKPIVTNVDANQQCGNYYCFYRGTASVILQLISLVNGNILATVSTSGSSYGSKTMADAMSAALADAFEEALYKLVMAVPPEVLMQYSKLLKTSPKSGVKSQSSQKQVTPASEKPKARLAPKPEDPIVREARAVLDKFIGALRQADLAAANESLAPPYFNTLQIRKAAKPEIKEKAAAISFEIGQIWPPSPTAPFASAELIFKFPGEEEGLVKLFLIKDGNRGNRYVIITGFQFFGGVLGSFKSEHGELSIKEFLDKYLNYLGFK